MRKTKRSAFTIVELVIVIAVIAILSAVLIPTFGAIIKNANVASDQSTAATLTTELHIYLKGETIDSEAELMEAINAIDPDGKKLVPKALNHDHHFWFDMENQMIVAGFTEDIKNKTSQSTSKIESQSGAVLTSAELIAETSSNTAFLGMRDVFNNGFFLIDSADALNEMFGNMSDIDISGDNSYANFISKLEKAKDNEVYGVIAGKIFENFQKTIVFNNNGVFYFGDNTSDAQVYFADGIKIIPNVHHVYSSGVNKVEKGTLPTPAGNISLPSSVILVEEGALNFATANSVIINTKHADHSALATVLSPNCSNAIFTDASGLKYIVTNEERTDAETNEKETVGVLHQYFDAETATQYKCDLVKRVPYADYTLGSNENIGYIEWHTENGVPTLFLSITQSGKVTFYMEDTATHEKNYATVNKWDCDNNAISISAAGVLTFDTTALSASNDYTAEVVAETYNINGERKDISFNIEIVKPTQASIQINGLNHKLDGVDKQITLDYDGSNTYDVTLNGVTYSSTSHSLGSNQIMIATTGNDSMIGVNGNKTLSFDISKSDNTIVVTVDGCLATKFIINLNNTEKAEFKHNFYKSRTNDRPYYIGEGNAINLSALFSPKGTFAEATITIYDQLDNNQYYYVNEINNTDNGVSATYPKTITSSTDWSNATITFDIDKSYDDWVENDTYLIYIEVTGSNNVSVIYTFNIAEDAENVLGANFNTLGTATSDIVLHGNVASVANSTKINLGANALYGNGYIINAKSYKSTNNTVNDSFIVVGNGGKVDNVYLDGPVYPEFEYTSSTKGYHVSGVKVEGTATVSNSYVAGFRQPIQVNGGDLTLKNSTLYGGSYANMQLVKGTVTITDVTTIQPNNGITDTFNQGKDVIGLGIVVEKDAVDSTTSAITIDGYLDQYNWVSYKSTADFPTLVVDGSKMDFKVILAAMFNGMTVTLDMGCLGTKTIERKLNFLDAYLETEDGIRYLNTGIIFMALGTGKEATTASTNVGNLKVVYDDRTSSSYVTSVEYTPQPLPLFSGYPVLESSGVTISAAQMMRSLEKFTIDSNTGKAVATLSFDALSGIANPIDVYLKIWSYTAANVDLGATGCPLTWTQGYYIDYGVTTTN